MLYLKSYVLKSYGAHPLHTPYTPPLGFLISLFCIFPYFLIKTGHRNPDKWIPGAESFVFVR